MSGIQMGLMGAGGGIVVPIPGGNSISIGPAPGPVSADINVQSNGVVDGTGNDTNFSHNWYNPTLAGVGNAYWVRATLTSGTTPTSGTMGTWLALSSTRQWTNTRTTIVGSKTSTLLFEIATDAGGVNIVTSGAFVLTAILE